MDVNKVESFILHLNANFNGAGQLSDVHVGVPALPQQMKLGERNIGLVDFQRPTFLF